MKTRQPSPSDYRERTYRDQIDVPDLVSFEVVCQETNLMIQAQRPLDAEALSATLSCRGEIEAYIRQFPAFATTLVPWPKTDFAPPIVRRMVDAARLAGVGPMAAVAGAISEYVGRTLLCLSDQVVVENGGDLFVKTNGPLVAALFAGISPFSMKMGIRVEDTKNGLGICTSSGTVGHSLSCGRADAVCVVSESGALSDAAATAIGNQIHSPADIDAVIRYGRQIDGVLGIIVVMETHVGAWGAVELVPLQGKKG
ncbi:UPF0280 family protein [Desulfosarcina sp. OttesenSCG-928-A07]|nr:UPF0280 family protein [Desulfosarcina sp. OttesenSCG-928-G17]MDL2329610.1 UPF0280 family protein [Desulfosarcina sp. OttesenSCG-928-A07]